MPSKSPEQYNQQLKNLDTKYNLILNELTSAFPYAKTYPKIEKYQKNYSNDEGNLTKLNSDLFLFTQSLQGDINDVSNSISRIVKQVTKLEKDNKILMIELQSLSNKSAGAVQAYSDSNFIYNYKYYENLVFFLIISGLGYTFYKSIAKGNISK